MPSSRAVTVVLWGLTAAATPLPGLGRLTAVAWLALLFLSVVSASRSRVLGIGQALLATFVGAAPAFVIVGVLHDLPGVALPLPVSGILLLGAWTTTSVLFGTVVASRVSSRRALTDVWLRVLGVALSTGFIAGALVRLLRPAYSSADRLAWTLSEEDNAQIVGIAREVLVGGPRGAELADQYGTAFINLPLLLLRFGGGPLESEIDLRLQAITVYLVSTIAVILLAGLAMALIGALTHHVHQGRRSAQLPSTAALALGPVAVGLGAIIGFSLLVVLPMRTGFLTFVWGLTIVLLGAAAVAITPADAPPAARLVLTAHLIGSLLLLFSSWPFVAPALAPLFLVPLLWVPWKRVRVTVRSHRGRALVGALGAVAGLGATTFWFFRWGPAAEVLSYGIDILLIGASGIGADEPARRGAMIAIATAAALVIFTAGKASSVHLSVSLVGPVLGGGLLYLGLRSAAALLTDGQLNYSGIKLLYGVITLAIVIGLLGVASQSSRFRAAGVLVSSLLALGILQSSETANVHRTWWDRTYAGPQLHAQATIDAIRSSSAGLPIRCLPSPGTTVNSETRLAAYFCARWVEDAFNEGRFGGHRFELLDASGNTFEETVEDILARSPSEYLFAYRMTMGPGWFGWTGYG